MELPDPDFKLNKNGKQKRDLKPDEASIIVAQAAGGLIGAQGSLNVLDHLQNIVISEDTKRRSDTKELGSGKDAPETELEKFVKADYPSHLLKIAELENMINLSKQSVRIIDETDISGDQLYDHVEAEVQDEVRAQLEGLKSISAIKDSLKTELKSLASNAWESHKETKLGTENERYKHYETMILGNDPKIKDQKDLKTVKDDILGAEEVYEMLTFEKMRMTMGASLCSPEEKPQKEMEAFEVMGEEFSLIKSQMEHMEKMLEIDWLKSVPGEGIQDPAKGVTLICPELLARMDGDPSDDQIRVINEAYDIMAKKRDESLNNRDKIAEKTSFCLASMQFLEMGKKAKFMNAFKEIRNVSKEKIEEIKGGIQNDELANLEETPTPDENESKKELLKEGLQSVKAGVGKMIKACPAVLAAQIWVMTKAKSKDEYAGHYGSMSDIVQYSRELGLARIDDPL